MSGGMAAANGIFDGRIVIVGALFIPTFLSQIRRFSRRRAE